jgi:hypothetical protein
MKFKRPRRLSSNIEDRRGAGPVRRGGMGLPAAGGAGGLAAVVALALAFCGGGGGGFDLSTGGSLPGTTAGAGTELEVPLSPDEDPNRAEAELASVVLDNLQLFWDEVFAANGIEYSDARLVLFTGETPTGCGQGSSATGPFYCSLDDTIYIDLSFWEVLRRQFGAGGDFAQAYVIAHEIGHHLQNLLGISAEVRGLAQQNPNDRNALSVRQELQADCFAGVWANSIWTDGDAGDPNGIEIDRTDLREALDAAAAVGDDRIQQQTQGRLNPETWTHGSADQRQEWFETGFETGDPAACDTFS